MPFPPHRTRLRRGRLCRALLASAALAAGGCEAWRTAKVDHPVMGPPPPRLSWDEAPAGGAAVADASGSSAGYVKVGLSDPAPFSDHAVVAIVNGEPILAGEVLAPFNGYFLQAAARGEPAWKVEQAKKEVIREYLGKRIDMTLLVQSLRLMLKPEQIKQMEGKLDEEWKKISREIMEKQGVTSKVELERLLAEKGESLAAFEQSFKNEQLGMLYRETKAGERTPVVGRQEILDYYHANLARYEHPARARFQLLMVSFGKDKAQARAKLDTALAELDAGEAFGDVAKRHSDGPHAKQGGQWNWLKPGEFADAKVDRALFELPVAQVSDVFETANAFVVVKITEREPAGRTPLAEVQGTIRATLLKQAREKTLQDLLAQLHEQAVVTTYLD